MSFPISVIIMLVPGIAGGTVNYLLPSNVDAATMLKLRTWLNCVVLGIGATILIPLFLEIAQSRLMDNIHLGYAWQKGKEMPAKLADTAGAVIPVTAVDSAKVREADSGKTKPPAKPAQKKPAAGGTPPPTPNQQEGEGVPLKNYFLFTAYCFLAAAAGVRFINNIIDSVLKDRQIAVQKEKIEKSKEELEKERLAKEEAEKGRLEAEKQKTKLAIQNRVEAIKEEEKVLNNPEIGVAELGNILPVIGPVTNKDDPQKGRFGGKSKNNFRELKAEVTKSVVPEFFNVKIWVEGTDPQNHPLDSDCIFYIHDSFRPSVYPVKAVNGVCMDDGILAYGAFTVGVVADNGLTLLEKDLADDERFPKQFRER